MEICMTAQGTWIAALEIPWQPMQVSGRLRASFQAAVGTGMTAHASFRVVDASSQAVALPHGHLHCNHGATLKLDYQHWNLLRISQSGHGTSITDLDCGSATETCRTTIEACIRKLASPLRRRFQRALQKPCTHAWQPCTRALQLLGNITWITALGTSIAPLETCIIALAAAITALRNMLAHVFKLLALALQPLRVHSTCIKEDQLEATINTTLLAMTTRAVGNVLGSQLSQESVAWSRG